MNLLCQFLGHVMAPANPIYHPFLGSYCIRCQHEEPTILDEDSRRLHYDVKKYLRRMAQYNEFQGGELKR